VDEASIADILNRARQIDDPAVRARFLARECGGDVELRTTMQTLLGAEGETHTPEALEDPIRPISERPGDRIANYKLLQPLGDGGFGTVWMAEQERPVARRVALKILKPGMDSREVIARFSAERQALALMNHPGIAKIHDAGSTPAGRPYFVMELVQGIPITDYCDRENLSTHNRLELFIQVCNAVQHAHQKGIIHRDIKPGNVLVGLVDGRPSPKVIDFGIAKAIGARLSGPTMLTRIGEFIGTPAYMSPEQTEMTALDVDTRSDIYSLGVLLYELLTGTTPFDSTRLRQAGLAEIQRIYREEEPNRPSMRVSSLRRTPSQQPADAAANQRSGPPQPPSLEEVARRRHTDPAALGRLLRGDLDWIVMKALEKDRTRRYETANGFAADVGRFLRGEPVVAAPPGAAYRARKFVRRHRGLVTASAVVVAALLVGIAGTTWGLVSANRQRRLAETRATQLEEVARFQSEQLGGIDVPLMGLQLREDLLNEVQTAAERSGLEAGKIGEERAELERLVAGVDFTGLALHSLRTNVLERALRAIHTQFADQPVTRARLLQTVADTAVSLGLLDLAAAPQTEALQIRRAQLGNDNADTLASINSAAMFGCGSGPQRRIRATLQRGDRGPPPGAGSGQPGDAGIDQRAGNAALLPGPLQGGRVGLPAGARGSATHAGCGQ
jgi:eukaryotic-like serine/threonine-protein kinase